MKCFIASAFDHEVVDTIYKKAITPVLRKLKIKQLRVDRIEHNDDIDDKIFSLIRECDLCIADLTYARPSVYYEAGFAWGLGRPVIYISRKDHLHPRIDDEAGNLRVHFDLQMKNIIPWTSPNETFKNRLLKRIKHVCRGITPKEQRQTKQSPEEIRYKSLSIDDQIRAVLTKGTNLIFARGFHLPAEDEQDYGVRRLGREPANQASFERFRNNVYESIKLVARNSFTKSDFHSTSHSYKSFSQEEKSKLKAEHSVVLYALLQPVRQTSIRTALSSYTPIGDGIYRKTNTSFRLYHDKWPFVKKIAFIEGYKSVSEFSQLLKDKFSLLFSNRQS